MGFAFMSFSRASRSARRPSSKAPSSIRPYKKIEELMNVKGIGEKSFLKLKPMVTVGPDKAEKSGDRH